MENLFASAKFGDRFMTRDGRMALFLQFDTIVDDGGKPKYDIAYVYTLQEGEYPVLLNGIDIDNPDTTSIWDIVSRWEEPIDENELQELANEDAEKAYILKDSNYNLWYLVTETFKRGYLKAKDNG